MIQLTLVRHAEAHHGGPDHDRRLSERGRSHAADMSARVLREGIRPETVLTSTASRARETATVFAEAFGAELVENADLYASSASVLLDAARAHGASEVMVVAHDPGMSALVSDLADDEVRMPTCAVAIFTWHEGDWSNVGVTPPDEFALHTPN